jgi:hypothetical protein
MRRLTAVVCLACVAPVAAMAETALQADAFVDSIGVNTHLSYFDTPYSYEWSQTFQALQAMGVRHIRDGYFEWGSSNALYARHRLLASSGIHCDYVIGYQPWVTAENIVQFKNLVGDMESVEGPNEYDDNGGGGWQQRLQQFLPKIAQIGQSAGVPVVGPSFVRMESYAAMGNISRYMSYNNLHVYFGGRNPGATGWGSTDRYGHGYGSFGWWIDSGNMDAPGVPQIITETGYITYPNVRKPYTVPDRVAAAYIPRTYLEAFAAGVKRTYAYELIDEPVLAKGYGLLNQDMSPKPAFIAVSNLAALLTDKGPGFRTGALNYTLSGDTNNVHHVLMQKRDGSFWLALWVENSIYNPVNNTDLPLPRQNVTLNIEGRRASTLHAFNDDGWASRRGLGGRSTVQLQISQDVSVVEIR